MFLLVLILNDARNVPQLLARFMESGFSGTTVLDCHGGARVLQSSDIEPPPVFGSLLSFINEGSAEKQMVLTVVSEDEKEKAKDIVHEVVGDLSKPDTGIMFALPVSDAEGIRKK